MSIRRDRLSTGDLVRKETSGDEKIVNSSLHDFLTSYALHIEISIVAEIHAPFQNTPNSDRHHADVEDDASRRIADQMKVVVPGELASVIVLKESRQVSGNADCEDERDCHPERSVKIRINTLKTTNKFRCQNHCETTYEMSFEIVRRSPLWND